MTEMDLFAFIRRCHNEVERVAQAATTGPWWHNPGKAWLDPAAFEAFDRSKGEEFVGYGESPFSGCIAVTGPASHAQSMNDAQHIALHNPAHVLARVAAERAILAEHEVQEPDEEWRYCRVCQDRHTHQAAAAPCRTVRLLALAYADWPGYRNEWRPT